MKNELNRNQQTAYCIMFGEHLYPKEGSMYIIKPQPGTVMLRAEAYPLILLCKPANCNLNECKLNLLIIETNTMAGCQICIRFHVQNDLSH